MFDSGICIFRNDEEREELVKQNLSELEAYGIVMPDSYRETARQYYQEEAELKRTTVDFLGAHLCCFSTDDSSILMWSHYARENKGICVRYDTGDDSYLKKWAFPIVYRDQPINVAHLLYDHGNGKTAYQYSTELAVMISTLCKNSVWSYENEWRLISPLIPDEHKQARYHLQNAPQVQEIIFGYHFLRNCYEEEGLQNVLRLLNHAAVQGIATYVMLPATGSFELDKVAVDVRRTVGFIRKEFLGHERVKEGYYGVIQRSFLRELCGRSL